MKIVVSYRGAPRIRGWETGAMIARGFRELGYTDVYEYGNIYESSERLNNTPSDLNDIDLWVYCEMNDGDPQYWEIAEVPKKYFVSCLYDNSYYPDGLTGLDRHFRFDYNFIANPHYLDRFPNSHHLPYACDPSLHLRSGIWSNKRPRRAILVGSIREDRKQLAQALSDVGIQLDLIGGVFKTEYVDSLATADIVINQNPPQGAGLLNMRAFEAPAAGCLLLTEKRDLLANNLDVYYCHGYNSIDDIIGVCSLDKYTLLSERKRCQESVLRAHTYKHRCMQILETIK
jgi:hypothetical protein